MVCEVQRIIKRLMIFHRGIFRLIIGLRLLIFLFYTKQAVHSIFLQYYYLFIFRHLFHLTFHSTFNNNFPFLFLTRISKIVYFFNFCIKLKFKKSKIYNNTISVYFKKPNSISIFIIYLKF